MTDKRYQIIKTRLSELSKIEIQRILDNIDMLCVDTFNYDGATHKFCLLALGMNLHLTVSNPTDQKIKEEIGKRFMPVNIISGVQGKFFTDNRKEDIVNICNELLKNGEHIH